MIAIERVTLSPKLAVGQPNSSLKNKRTPRTFFPLYTGVTLPIYYVPTTSFKLMTLQNIKVKEALFSKGASVTMKQKSHPVSSKKNKKEKTQICNYAL